MAKRDEKGRFQSIEKADSGGDTASPATRSVKDRMVPPTYTGELEDFLPGRQGLTESEGATLIEDFVAEDAPTTLEGYEIPEDFEGDVDAAREALKRLHETGDRDAAQEALAAALELIEGAEEEDTPEDGDEPDGPESYHDFTEEELETPVKVKVQGEEVTVPLREALGGYQRQADYTRKTEEVAREREAVQETRSELDARLSAAQERLALLDHAMGADMSPQQRAVIAQTFQQVQAQRQALEAHRLQEVLPQEHERLKEALGWKSEDDVEAGKRLIAQAAVETYGFEPADLKNIHDHRLLVMAHDAARYRELMARQEEVKGEVRGKRKRSPTLKPGTAGQNTAAARASRQAKKARQQLARTGRVDDAAQVILSSGIVDE